MSLSGQQYRQLQDALLSAFPTYGALERMVRFTLDERLELVTAGTSLQTTVFHLIQWAESRGRIQALVAGALEANPGNTKLNAIAEALAQAESPPTNIQATREPNEVLFYNARGRLQELSTQLIRADWQELKRDQDALAQILETLREAIADLEKLREQPLGERINLTRALEEAYTALSALTLAADLARIESPRRSTAFYDNIRLSRESLKQAVRALSGEREDKIA